MNPALRFAGLALLSSWAVLLSPAAAASAIQEYAVWEVHARLNGEAQPTSRWLSRAEVPTGLQLGTSAETGRWAVQLWFERNADGMPMLMHSLQSGEPPQDFTLSSTTGMEGDRNIIRARSADDRGELELRVHATRLAVPMSNPKRSPVAPVYPPAALAQGIEGVVMLQVSVDERGQILGAQVESSSTPDVFETSALTSAASWILNPPRDDDGQAMAGTIRIPVAYQQETDPVPSRQRQENGEIKPRKKRKR